VTRPHLDSLEIPSSELRAMLEQAARRVVEHLASLPQQPMHGTAGAYKLAAH
jgi:hypothetical protein